MKKNVLMQGNEACVEGALIAGMRFFCGLSDHPIYRNCRNLRSSSAA